MLKDIQIAIDKLEEKRRSVINTLQSVSTDQLTRKPEPDKWSLLQELQHIVWGERAMRLSEEALRKNPMREQLKPGKLVDVVKNVLENDVPVDVPHPSLEPDGNTSLSELQALWYRERQLLLALFETVKIKNVDAVMFSHPAAGPLNPLQTLELALIHLDYHYRRIINHLQGV
jgi:hypothetical protein